MDRKQKTQNEAASAEPRYDRQLAVMLEGVLDLALAASRHDGQVTAPSRLVQRALALLRKSDVPETFLTSPFNPDRHRRLLDLAGDD
jgi:hypothetical protein